MSGPPHGQCTLKSLPLDGAGATTSPMEFVERRYGLVMRQGLAYLGGVLIVLDDATKIMAIGIVVSASLGLPTMGAILACGLIMLTYTLLGGLWAVLIGDVPLIVEPEMVSSSGVMVSCFR